MIKPATNEEISTLWRRTAWMSMTGYEQVSRLLARIDAEYHDRLGTEGAAGLLQEQSDELLADAARYRWLAAHCRSTHEHWGGRWSIIVDGPAPKTHDSEDDFDAAIDAAIAKAEAK